MKYFDKINTWFKHFTFLLISFISYDNYAQCNSCTINYPTNTGANIYVNPGETICIDIGVTCSGMVFLNGGTICNLGKINNLILNEGSGTVNNYGTIYNSDLDILATGDITFNNYAGSQTYFEDGKFNLDASDSLVFENYNGALLKFTGLINISSKKLTIHNGLVNADDPSILDQAVFEADQTISIGNADFDLENTTTGSVVLLGTLNLSDIGNKSIINSGVVTIVGDLSVVGDGSSITAVSIINQGTISVQSDANFNLTNGTIYVENKQNSNPEAGSLITVGSDVSIGSPLSTIKNNSNLNIASNLNMTNGSFINNKTLSILGNINNSGGVIDNNYISNVYNVVNTSGTINDVGFLQVAGGFTNTGVFTLGKKATLNTYDYYNKIEGVIHGPTLNAAEVVANEYGRIIINGYSKNETSIDGYLQVYDLSLNCGTGSNGFGFDQVLNSSTIDGNVNFVSVCNNTEPEILCTSPMIELTTYGATSAAICPQDSAVNFSSKFGWYLCLFPVEIQFNPITTGVTYNWQPGNFNTSSIGVSPTVTTVYTLTVHYQNCTYTDTMRVTVRDDCPEEIIGCCFSNYGAGVYLNDTSTFLNIYCNLINEISPAPNSTSPPKKGEFKNIGGRVSVSLDWIHNALNRLYEFPAHGFTSLFGNAQKIRGVSVTRFDILYLEGQGTKTMKIDAEALSDLNLTSNRLDIRNHKYSILGANAIVSRTYGYASTGTYGFFSRALGHNIHDGDAGKEYLFPLGSLGDTVLVTRYRPVIMLNSSQQDWIKVNFMNIAPQIGTDVVFAGAGNNITVKSPAVVNVNQKYYHKIKQDSITASPSDLTIRSYFLPSDGVFQSLTEWRKNPNQTTDWWSSTPGPSANYNVSTDPLTAGLAYAETIGTYDFAKPPFALSLGGFYINTNNFGNPNNTNITVIGYPSNPGGNSPIGGGLGGTYNTGGNVVFTPNPIAGDYEINISSNNNCDINDKVKFTIDPSGSLDPENVEYGLAGSSTYLGKLSKELFSVDNQNTGITLKSSPSDLIRNCLNSIVVKTSQNADYVYQLGDTIEVFLPSVNIPATISYGQFKIYDIVQAPPVLVYTSSNLVSGNNIILPGTLAAGVYRFEFSVQGNFLNSETIKGQFIAK
jgi:hypothetical protein